MELNHPPQTDNPLTLTDLSLHLAWSFLHALDKEVISELTAQVAELSGVDNDDDEDDEAKKFFQQDPEGSLLISTLSTGLERLKGEGVGPEEWTLEEVFAVAWMIRDLVVAVPAGQQEG
jgi:hypothetical protein